MNSSQPTDNNSKNNDSVKRKLVEPLQASPWQFLTSTDASQVHQASWARRFLVTSNTPWFIDDAYYIASLLEEEGGEGIEEDVLSSC